MVNQYFQNDAKKLDFILSIYSCEIIRRVKWTVSAAEEVNRKLNTSPSNNEEIIREATDMINNAMAILRMIEPSGRPEHPEWAQERIAILKNKWSFPQPPAGLRRVRNMLEHFEEKIDEWAINSPSHNYVDLHVGEPIGGVHTKDHFRRFERELFYFWGQSVNLTEVCRWVLDVKREILS